MSRLDKLKSFLIYSIHRTLRVDILTLFLSLFLISFSLIISFSYYKHKQAIETFSLGTIARASSVVFERVRTLILDANRFPILTTDIIENENAISSKNEVLTRYMLKIVQLEKSFSHIFIATKSGGFLGANDLTTSTQRTYINAPSKPLPKDARYSLLYIDSSVLPYKAHWSYVDEQLRPISSEESSGLTYDPRTSVWYQEAIKTTGLYWSDTGVYFPTGDKGINVSTALYNKQADPFGVIGVQLSFSLFSQFLSEQQIGKTGRVFLLNGNGEELVTNLSAEDFYSPIVRMVYDNHKQTHQDSFRVSDRGIDYLAYVHDVVINPTKKWFIVVVVPHEDFFGPIVKTEQLITLFAFFVLVLTGFFVFRFSKKLSTPIITLANEVNKIKHLDLSSELRVKSNIKEIIIMDSSIASMRTGLRSFARYVPRKVVEKLLEKGEELTLGGEKKEITVFFSDIAGFTHFSEMHSTDEVMTTLSEYLDALSKLILEEGGIIDKYIGDSIMAFWGAPSEIQDHAARACTAAIRCQAFLTRFNNKRKESGQTEFPTRIVINTGAVLIGNIGTPERINYTVMGDTVNTAAHLQVMNKIYHVKILITEATYVQIKEHFLVRPLDIVIPAGKTHEVKIYELMALLRGDRSDLLGTSEQTELCTLFSKAFEAFHSNQQKEAKLLFSAIRQKFPEDLPTQLYLKRLE